MNIQAHNNHASLRTRANRPQLTGATSQGPKESFTLSGGPSPFRSLAVGTALVGVAAGATGLAAASTGWVGGTAGAITGLAVGGTLAAIGSYKSVPNGVGAGPALAKVAVAGVGGVVGGGLAAAGGAWLGASFGDPTVGLAVGLVTAGATGYGVYQMMSKN